jgi:hypothetical protein
MPAINWRERFIAVAIHFTVTLCLAGAAAVVIFFVWFPHGLADIVGGENLFLLVVGCDVALGPLVSLVIYNSAKPRKELIFDYVVVGLVQLAALAYGIFVVAGSRPAFIVFDVDRLEIVTALELEPGELAKATDPVFAAVPVFGPRMLSLQRPTDQKEKNELMFIEVQGRTGAYLFPKYYRSYDAASEKAKTACRSLATLMEGSGAEGSKIKSAVAGTGLEEGRLCWLLAHHRFGFGIALVDRTTLEPVRYVPVNPTWIH